jgi:hypothetical protein
MADITLPEVVVRPGDPQSTMTAGAAPSGEAGIGGSTSPATTAPETKQATPTPPQTIPVQVQIATARANGYSWDEINQHMAAQQQQALDVGYTPAEIDQHLGYQDPQALQDRLAATAQRANAIGAVGPEADVEITDPAHVQTRQAYADAMVTGETKGPQDFSASYHGAGMPPVDDLHQQLPDHADVTDHAIALANDAGLPLTPDLVQQTKANVLDRWAATGDTPAQTYAAASADPILRDRLTRMPPDPMPPLDMAAIERMESGGNPNAVSKAGAMGLMQVTPDTARSLGFDPDKLLDPLYNRMVATAVMRRNAAMFPGDTEAQLIAYNAGPGRAEAFIRGGRDLASLPGKTVNYLKKYAGLVGSDVYAATKKVFDPLASAASSAWQTVGGPLNTILNAPENAIGAVAHAAGFSLPGTVPVAEPDMTGKTLVERASEPVSLGIAAQMAAPGATQEAEAEAAVGVGNMIRGWFGQPAQTPLTGETQAVIRQATGEARQGAVQAAAKLEQYRATVNQHLPEYASWLSLDPATRAANEPYLGKPLIANLIDHIEGRSSGVTLDPASPFAPVADAIRDVYQGTRQAIEDRKPDFGSFYEDYYRHMWADPAQADRLVGGGRMGSNASLKLRTIPTISDGLAQGLVPRILDPIDNTLHYVNGMRNYLAQDEVLQWGRDAGHVKYSLSGPPEDGWEALKGRGAEKAVPLVGTAGEPSAGLMRAYAPPSFARSYNHYVEQGFLESPVAGPIYQKVQAGTNALTAWKLGLSAYHAGTMTKELLNAGLAHGIGDIASGIGSFDAGQVANGLWNVFGTVLAPVKIGQQLIRGARLTRAYSGQADFGAFMGKLDAVTHLNDGSLQDLADLYASAGGRATGRGAEYAIGQSSNLFQAWRRGSLAAEFQKAWGNSPIGALAKGVGDTLSTISAPLFDYAIPRIKFAAWSDEMQSWLRRNPTADTAAKQAMARRLSNAMDDRFGEMVLDNVFWPKMMKQALNAATISVGWNYGTLRMVGTGLREMGAGLKGAATLDKEGAARLLSPEARALYAYPVMMALTASAYQYLKTGALPTQTGTPWLDVAAPRTGGRITLGSAKTHVTVPERAQLPGYDKDFDSWYFDVANAPTVLGGAQNFFSNLPNKLNPAFGLAKGLMTGKNYFGEPIAEHTGVVAGLEDYAKYVLNDMAPIALEQQATKQAGSHISFAENLLGPRTAPSNLLTPERAKHVAYNMWLRGVRESEGFQRLQQERASGKLARPFADTANANMPTSEGPPQPEPAPAATPDQTSKRSHHKAGVKRTRWN